MILLRYYLVNISVFISFGWYAQVTDQFTDGDFTANPTWTGSTADFLVNNSNQLQLNASIASTSYLSLANGLTDFNTNKEWRFYIKQSFAGSSSNFGRIYLTADNPDLTLAQNGFYVQFGESGSLDAIRLFKLSAGTSTQICAGPDAQIVNSINASIRVKRNTNGDWLVYTDFAGGENYTLLTSGNDPSTFVGTYFGMSCVYTASNATKFYYDNIYVGDEILDLAPPTLVQVTALSTNTVDVQFNESVSSSATDAANFLLTPTIGIASASIDVSDASLVHLVLSGNLQNGSSYNLQTNNIADLVGNVSGQQNLDFQLLIGEVVQKGDVIITEIFPDPSPRIGLPEKEFVEIYNHSNKVFDLTGWKLGDASADGTITSAWLLPGEYKVLCGTSSVDSFAMTTAVGVTSFPSLNNASDDLVLKDNLGLILDKVSYYDTWYNDEVKKDGGFTLELINPNDPCSAGDNWTASNSSIGGTPGSQNSVFDTSPDTTAPTLLSALALSPNFLEITFSEGMDSATLMAAIFACSPNLSVQNIYIQGAYPSSMIMQFSQNIALSQTYTFTLDNVADCWNNATDVNGIFILPDLPQAGEIVINEILQNPLTGGQDWVELYNNSDKVFDLKDWQMANFDNDTIANFKTINKHFLLLPNDYVVLGKDSNFVKNNYPSAVSGKFLYAELPSYNNDSGSIYLIYNSTIIDKVAYNNAWQFALLDNNDGVSLERIDPNGPSSKQSNWHSAAESIGFGTPGRINSQYKPSVSNGEFSLSEEVFSPDNDGFQDILQINYQMPQPDLLGKINIYDDRGRLIRKLFSNELLGTKGTFFWDGVNDNQTKASIGVYVIVFEVFSTDGSVFFSDKKGITLAGKL